MAVDTAVSMISGYSDIQALELALERQEKSYSLTCEQEESRRIRTDLLLLQFDNADLQAQLLEKEEHVDVLEEDLEEQVTSIGNLNEAMNNLRLELRMKLKEAERLKVEVNSLQAMSLESSKLIEEKLSLVREISSMRPEIEHLRAQQATNANVLSEKLSLQRELNTLQVALENEKRAVQKALSRDDGRSSRESKLETELESYKANLAKEKSQREKLEREVDKSKGTNELQRSSNETKLDEYRAKLKSAKEQIKSTRAELDEARKANERLSQQSQRIPQPSRGKRSYTHMDTDGTIGTPDGFPPKKNAQLLLGEKSGFGLTPFLRQSKKLIVETPKNEPDNVDRQEEEEVEVESAEDEALPAPVESAPVQAKKVDFVRPVAKVKAKPKQPMKASPQKKKQVQLEEIEEENETPAETFVPSVPAVAVEEEVQTKDPVPRKKRRMLGAGPGKTLFDDDENVTGKLNSRGGLEDFKFAMPKRVTLAPKTAAVLGTKAKSSAMSGFGAFSPLKKDRKR